MCYLFSLVNFTVIMILTLNLSTVLIFITQVLAVGQVCEYCDHPICVFVCRQNNWTTRAAGLAEFGTERHIVNLSDEFNSELKREFTKRNLRQDYIDSHRLQKYFNNRVCVYNSNCIRN